MMNRFFTLLLAASCLTAVGQTEYPYPYNPDGNNDGHISLNDLLDLLSVYGAEFNAGLFPTDQFQASIDSVISVEFLADSFSCVINGYSVYNWQGGYPLYY